MTTPHSRQPAATGFNVEPTGNANAYALTVHTATNSLSVTIDVHGAASLAGLLVMRLTQSQSPEVHAALNAFALRSIEAKASPDGIPYLEYKLENGLRFASGFSADEMRALHRNLGDVLAQLPNA